MNTTSFIRTLAWTLIVLGALIWFIGLLSLVMTSGQHWRFGIGLGGLTVFVGCCLWHAARWKGGARR